VTLFHFSALTFNAHRIHYDHPYVTGVEGYPGVVVHGPLIALLLLDAAVRRGRGAPALFSYRAVAPLFSGERFAIEGRGDRVAAIHPERGVAMEASVER
jgi:3-methylfumaryl-CoA hydratase